MSSYERFDASHLVISILVIIFIRNNTEATVFPKEGDNLQAANLI